MKLGARDIPCGLSPLSKTVKEVGNENRSGGLGIPDHFDRWVNGHILIHRSGCG
jgi:hypothetical protein